MPNAFSKAPNFHPPYRPDVDGLRALAIIAVVLFHAFPSTLTGGFVGVDIFFVISGFLISSIIFKSLAAGSFSFARFYANRVRRIFPALTLVLASCITFGWFALLPDEYKQLGKHIVGGAGFVQNFLLWKEAGYFDTASELKPLMHLWSLSIEEQFYLLYPAFLWAAWRMGLNIFIMAFLIAIASFIANICLMNDEAIATFFLPQTRFWELLVGGVLAHLQLFNRDQCITWMHRWVLSSALFKRTACPEKREVVFYNILALSGLLLIMVATFGLDKGVQFPGWRALIPVSGACLLILAGPAAIVNRRILANRITVFIGLISNPLYLWHWPLLSFSKIVESGEPTQGLLIQAVALSFLLAWLTYRLVEKPLRFGRDLKNTSIMLSVVMLFILFAGLYVLAKDGLPDRFKELLETKALFAWDDAGRNRSEACTKKYGADQYCNITDLNASPTVALIGDSHANHFFWGLSEHYQSRGENLINVGAGGCPPFFDVDVVGSALYDSIHCYSRTKPLYDFVLNSNEIKTVIIAFHRSGYFRDDIKIQSKDANLTTTNLSSYESARVALHRTITKLLETNKKVVLIYDLPDMDFDPKTCFISRPFASKPKRELSACAVSREKVDEDFRQYKKFIEEIQRLSPELKVFDTHALICDNSYCYAARNGLPLYRDPTHLSVVGSRFIASKFK